MKVVILAGGFGTRLAEAIDTLPKPMVEVGGRPLLWHLMRHNAHTGFWHCMDTLRDRRILEQLRAGGDPPWKIRND